LIFLAFTALLAAWYALGKVGIILIPLVLLFKLLFEGIVDAYKNKSGTKRKSHPQKSEGGAPRVKIPPDVKI